MVPFTNMWSNTKGSGLARLIYDLNFEYVQCELPLQYSFKKEKLMLCRIHGSGVQRSRELRHTFVSHTYE